MGPEHVGGEDQLRPLSLATAVEAAWALRHGTARGPCSLAAACGYRKGPAAFCSVSLSLWHPGEPLAAAGDILRDATINFLLIKVGWSKLVWVCSPSFSVFAVMQNKYDQIMLLLTLLN